jgi:hypothetical protein
LALTREVHALAIVTSLNISFKGNTVLTDSYDSADPLHNTDGRYDPAKRKAGGDIASNLGSIDIASASINGHLRTGPNGSYSTGPNGFAGDLSWTGPGVQPGWFANDFDLILGDVRAPFTSALAPTAGTGTNKFVLGNFPYRLNGDLVLLSDQALFVDGNADLYVTGNVDMRSASSIRIAPGGSLRLFVGGPSAALGFVNNPGPAMAFQYFGLPSNTSLFWLGVTNQPGILYAPQANGILGSGGGSIYGFDGAWVLRSLAANGHVLFHHDENLDRIAPYPPIINRLASRVAVLGQTVSFSVSPIGAQPFGYQWRFNGADLTGETNATLAMTNVTLLQAGTYGVTVTNALGSVSSDATLIVSDRPAAVLGILLTSFSRQIDVVGVLGARYRLDGSSNLVSWTPLRTAVSPFSFFDNSGGFAAAQFYRAVLVP